MGDDADDFERTIWNARGGELLFSAVDSVFVHYEGGVARGRIRSRIGRSHARRWKDVGGTVSGETDVGDYREPHAFAVDSKLSRFAD